MSPFLAPSRRQLEVQLETLLDRDPDARVLGVRSPIRRPWPETLERRGQRFHIAWCESELEARVALAALEDDPDARLLLVTNLEESRLGADVVARLPRARLIVSNRWDALRAAFRARDLDPRLRGQEWLSDLLLERPPSAGYPPVAGGVLDLDTAWKLCLEHAVGLTDARTDVGALLAWTVEDGNLERFAALPQTAREKVLEKLAADGGAAALLVAKAIEAGHGSDALAIGLVSGVIFASGEPTNGLREAAVRLEPMLGGSRIEPVAGGLLAEAAARVVARLAKPVAQVHQGRAAVLLEAIHASEFANRSSALAAGFEARLIAASEAIIAAADTGGAGALATAGRLVRRVMEHDRAPDHEARLNRLQMAARLCRWLPGKRNQVTSFHSAARLYAEEGGFVDWARASLRAGDDMHAVAAAFTRVRDLVALRREEENEAFARYLRDWNAGGGSGDGPLPIERTLDRIVGPLAAAAPVLLLVLDGLSFAVARALVSDVARLGWTELAPAGRTSPPPIVAALPTVTEVSRTSLFSGRLVRGDATVERSAFAAHPRLREVSRAGKPPVLFHKADLGAGPELNERIRSALNDVGQRVVGMVHNAVDAQLAGSDQIEIPWSAESLRQLAAVLRAAREAGRLLILTGDHGHVLEAGTVQQQGGSGDRWRTGGSPRSGEVELSGGRVLAPDRSQSVVLAWSEKLRYASKRSGYHGGASPQEVLVPLMVMCSGAAPPAWVEAPPPEPFWWNESDAVHAPVATPPVSSGQRQDKRQPELFGPREAPEGWIDSILASATYDAQRGMAGRGAPDDEVVRALIGALASRGGRLSRAALARMLGVPAFRATGIVNATRRVLNVDQAQVLMIDPASDEIVLDQRLLRMQFQIGDGL